MKKVSVFLISFALVCSLCGCAGGGAKQPEQKLKFSVVPTEEISFVKIPDEKKGSEKAKETLNKSSAVGQWIFCPHPAERKAGNTYSIPSFSVLCLGTKSLTANSCRFNQSFPKLVYQNLSEVNITLNGKTEPLAEAMGTGKITGAEIFTYARTDAENGFCKEGYASEQGLTRFVYTYPECALELVYDIFEGTGGKNVLINEITIADSTQSLFDSDSHYVDESSRWGYFLDREDWGLEFAVKAVTPESLTVSYTQNQS